MRIFGKLVITCHLHRGSATGGVGAAAPTICKKGRERKGETGKGKGKKKKVKKQKGRRREGGREL